MEADYPYVILPSDPIIRNIDDFIFSNIKRSQLHIVDARTPIIHCSNAIE
jgi:hypothetical protein